MIQNILNSLRTSTQAFFSNWKNLGVFTLIYALLVFALYLFFTTPEAKLWQIAFSIILIVLIPILFFALQVMSVKYTSVDSTMNVLLKRGFSEFWKLFLISLPFILLTWLAIWGMTKLNVSLTTRIEKAPSETTAQIKAVEQNLKNLARGFSAVWALLLYFILPLFSIQLWITTLREGFAPTLKRIFSVILRAFSPRSVITYLIGFVIFAVIPYFILTTRTPIKSPWLDVAFLGFRIALALFIALAGWVVTVGSINSLQKSEVSQ
jgi:hypothetical protein